MKKSILIVSILFIILVGIAFFIFKKSPFKDELIEDLNYKNEYQNAFQNELQNINKIQNQNDNNLVTSSENNFQNQFAKKTYSFEEVQIHNSEQSCWSVIRGKVYDLTDWINKHPGGKKAILNICGKDGTKIFVNQHGGKNNPEKVLSQFEIGEMQN